jgi:hypothetical protein
MKGLIHTINYDVVSADTLIKSGAGLLYGVLVTALTATNIITIRNGLTDTGDIVLSIPSGTAVGTYYECNGITLDTGIYAAFTGTGTICVHWSTRL